MISAALLYYGSAAIAIALSAIGTGVGIGLAGAEIMKQSIRQSLAQEPLFRRVLVIGGALIESGAIITLVASLLMVLKTADEISFDHALGLSGSLLAIGITACVIGLVSSLIVKQAAQAIARVPLFSNKIITFMLLTQAIMEAPVIFALITHFMVKMRITPVLTHTEASSFCAAGVCIAVGSIGPAIGQFMLAKAAMYGIGRNYHAYDKITPFTFLNQAFIETPVVFCLLMIGLILQKAPLHAGDIFFATKAWIATGIICMSALSSGIALGLVTRKSCEQIALSPGLYATMLRTTLLTVAFIESCIVYALIVALFLIGGS
jgi:F-type H+-transporting ATPase subunit c